ncbi:kynureninase [Planctomonas psychrotolerans]|uniref:kynureninase n=1 Tax=Planctomonas psychrotolerans TaxID=2528712 RepID=UPI001238A5F4|nr:aminotransferase class V-fold PLP-dependent enzyme [Planctomonas psychrotolerans]
MISLATARALDAADPLRSYRDLFATATAGDAGGSTEGGTGTDPFGTVYLDGNSLGRPTTASIENVHRFLTEEWGSRLIRGWDERWMALPEVIGDRMGQVALGAAPGQTIVGDSTTVLLYKLIRAALRARPDRDEVVIDADSFPTDRFVLQGIAAECGVTLRLVHTDAAAGVVPETLADVLGPRTALVVLSQVAYRSGFLADAPAITDIVHRAGALMLWDVCHSAGVVPTELDAWGVDIAVGCTYKYLNGGPGSPAFAYVRADLQTELEQPIWGWMGAADVFAMAPDYAPARGMRRYLSGTPPISAMIAMQHTLELIADAGMGPIREKSVALTEFVIELADTTLARHGVRVSSPRNAERRGSHVTLSHRSFRAVTAALWRRNVIPDFRSPDGLRVGLAPLSTSFEEAFRGMAAIDDELDAAAHRNDGAAPSGTEVSGAS